MSGASFSRILSMQDISMPVFWGGGSLRTRMTIRSGIRARSRKGSTSSPTENPEVDRLWEEGRREYDVEKRKQIYWRIHELMAEDQPYTFLFSPLGYFGAPEKIHAGGRRARRAKRSISPSKWKRQASSTISSNGLSPGKRSWRNKRWLRSS